MFLCTLGHWDALPIIGLCVGIHWSAKDHSHKFLLLQSFDVLFVITRNELLNNKPKTPANELMDNSPGEYEHLCEMEILCAHFLKSLTKYFDSKRKNVYLQTLMITILGYNAIHDQP